MSEKPKTATVAGTVLIDSLTNENVQLRKAFQVANDEITELKKQNNEFAKIVESEMKADKINKICSRSDYVRGDLEQLTFEQVVEIEKVTAKLKGADVASFKSIRAGNASEGRTTVGDLYGKSRKEILDMQGDF